MHIGEHARRGFDRCGSRWQPFEGGNGENNLVATAACGGINRRFNALWATDHGRPLHVFAQTDTIESKPRSWAPVLRASISFAGICLVRDTYLVNRSSCQPRRLVLILKEMNRATPAAA